jgi:DNA-binding transcriptional LysR family regulator
MASTAEAPQIEVPAAIKSVSCGLTPRRRPHPRLKAIVASTIAAVVPFETLKRPFMILWHRDRKLSKAAQAFVEKLKAGIRTN